MDPNKIVAAINALLGLIPVVGNFYTSLVEYRAEMQAISDAGGTVTEEQWADLDNRVGAKMAQINS